jgi:DNA-binding HxlR family transcriptional regulator
VARALDHVGERWALLVVRELQLGPKRFTDLRAGLPGVSQNVLSQRLRELADSGVIRQRRLGPPAPADVYELTERGQELLPVVAAVGAWGSRAPMTAHRELSVASFAGALATTFDANATAAGGVYELRLGDDVLTAVIANGALNVTRGEAADPQAVITASVATLTDVLFAGRSFRDAAAADDLAVDGDTDAARAFTEAFALPATDDQRQARSGARPVVELSLLVSSASIRVPGGPGVRGARAGLPARRRRPGARRGRGRAQRTRSRARATVHVMVSTIRKRASPAIILSYAACASASGSVSMRGRTPVSTEKRRVSSESCDVPEACP